MSSCHQAWVTGALGNIAHTFYLVIAIMFFFSALDSARVVKVEFLDQASR